VLVRPVVGDRVVKRTDMIPHQHVTFGPAVRELVLRLQLVREQGLEHPSLSASSRLVDADRVAGVAVEHAPARDRMREKQRMDGRRTTPALLRGERPPQAAGAAPHVLPELVESWVAVAFASRAFSSGATSSYAACVFANIVAPSTCRLGAAP